MFRSCKSVGQGLFSVLAFVVTLGVATDVLACVKITGGKLHYCSATRTTGTWTGSSITAATQLGDYQAELKEEAPGFFKAEWSSGANSFPCKHDGKDAVCTAAVVCNHIAVGTCDNGERLSRAMCPTTEANGFPGCHGKIIVTLTGGGKFDDGTTGPKTFSFDVDPNIDKGQCNQQFPRIAGLLDRGEIVRIKQSCSGDWSILDRVLSAALRNDLNDDDPSATYLETSGAWFGGAHCDADPNNGFPTGACSNDGGAWLTVSNPDPEESPPLINAESCAAAIKDLTCGDQLIKGVVVPGPAPKEFKLDSNGQCQFRCARCNPNGTLVNLQGGSNGTFVLADPKGVMGIANRPWAAICPVTVTGK
jgi:hypothetical protein